MTVSEQQLKQIHVQQNSGGMQLISMQQISKHISTTIGLLLEMLFFIQFMQSVVKKTVEAVQLS
jgi:hypothetical protein